MLKYLDEVGMKVLLGIINKACEEEKIPKDWELGMTVVI